MNLRTALAESSRSFPAQRVDLEHRGRPRCQVDEAAVIVDLSVTKQPCQQGQGMLCKSRVDEGFLPVQGCRGATAWLAGIVEVRVRNLRKEFWRSSESKP